MMCVEGVWGYSIDKLMVCFWGGWYFVRDLFTLKSLRILEAKNLMIKTLRIKWLKKAYTRSDFVSGEMIGFRVK